VAESSVMVALRRFTNRFLVLCSNTQIFVKWKFYWQPFSLTVSPAPKKFGIHSEWTSALIRYYYYSLFIMKSYTRYNRKQTNRKTKLLNNYNIHKNNRSMTVYRKQESMNERSIGIKSRYTNFHNIDNSARGDKTKLVTEKWEIFYCCWFLS